MIDEAREYFTGPRTLEELQAAAQQPPRPGFEDHHIVEQTPNAGRFPKEMIDGPDNIIRTPREKHPEISEEYSRADPEIGNMTPREYLRRKSWKEQYKFGLGILRK